MNKFSNILKIPASFDLYKEMVNKIALKLKSFEPYSDVPMFATTDRRLEDLAIINSPSNFGIKALYDSSKFTVKSLNELDDSEKFVMHLNVVQFNSPTIYEFVSLLCSNCKMRYL